MVPALMHDPSPRSRLSALTSKERPTHEHPILIQINPTTDAVLAAYNQSTTIPTLRLEYYDAISSSSKHCVILATVGGTYTRRSI